jgi:TRAP-type C4-dicarboxylate transport system substrate-binding protein
VRIVGAYGARSPRALQTTRGPIRRPEDLRGMKLRIPPIDVFQATFEALGVQNTPLGVGEIYTALSRGLVEGQDNGFDLSIPLRFHEVAKHWSATDHGFELTGWFISNRLWNSLRPQDRNALVAAARAGGEVTTRETEALDAEGIQILRQHNVTYTVPDRDAFRAATACAWSCSRGCRRAWRGCGRRRSKRLRWPSPFLSTRRAGGCWRWRPTSRCSARPSPMRTASPR